MQSIKLMCAHRCLFLQAIRNGVQEVAIKILAAADDAQLRSFKKVCTFSLYMKGHCALTRNVT